MLPLALACASLVAWSCGGGDDRDVILATTTSTVDSGLLDALAPLFEDQTGYHLKYVGVGSGAALEMAGRGDADAVLAHAPASEQKLAEQGVVIDRRLVMHNDFVIAGPRDDPAGIAGQKDAVAALQAIAESGAGFISRGDDSGTHQLELRLWKEAGIDQSMLSGYAESGQGMAATLQVADQRRAYALTDRGTLLANEKNLDLVPLVEGDPLLLNVYHVMRVNPEKFDGLNADGGAAFVEFMTSPDTQAFIGRFGVDEFGEPLFTPDAGKDESELTGR